MNYDELLPIVRSLPPADKVRLVKMLNGELLTSPSLPSGDHFVWPPDENVEAAEVLLAALAAHSHSA